MTIKHMRVFLAVCQEKSVTKAAKKMGMTQPATSLAIKELEEKVGFPLFERRGRGVEISRSGSHFYSSIVQLVEMYDEVNQEMKQWKQAGRIVVGSSISIGSCVLPQILVEFGKQFPKVDVRVKINSSEVIERLVLENQLDCALIEGTVHTDSIYSECFLSDELIPICGKFHTLAHKDVVTIEQLQSERFLMREKNSGTRELVENLFQQQNFFFEPVWESTSTAALINAVASGLGISVLPKRMVQEHIDSHRVFSFEIGGINLTRNYNLIYRKKKYLSPSLVSFFELIRSWEK